MGFNAYTLQVAMTAGVLSVVGLSVFIPWRAGLINLGASGFMAVGGYTSAILVMERGWPIAAGMIVGSLLAGGVAVVLGAIVLHLEGVYFAISTMAFAVIASTTAGHLAITGGAAGLPRVPSIFGQLADAMYGRPSPSERRIVALVGALIVWSLVALIIALVAAQRRSPYGRITEAVRTDRVAAEASGINTKSVRMVAFVQGGVVAGLAGGLTAHTSNFIDARVFGANLSLEAFIILILGGASSVVGAAIGAIIVTFLPELLRFMVEWRFFVYGIVVILLLAFEPKGFVGVIQRVGRRLVGGR